MSATISPVELSATIKRGKPVDLIDVRMASEFGEIHAVGARLFPLDQLKPAEIMKTRLGQPNDPIYLICKSGMRASNAVGRFAAAGFNNAVCVEGGTSAWVAAGLPVVRGAKAMSLERQVRIAAGLFVLIGVVLALTAHRYFFVIPALVGAGLIFAGVTDRCGMAMILTKMPWNRGQAATCSVPSLPA